MSHVSSRSPDLDKWRLLQTNGHNCVPLLCVRVATLTIQQTGGRMMTLQVAADWDEVLAGMTDPAFAL